jgi:hypothetical protein
MKEIILTRGMVANVDDEDYEYLNQWKWQARKSRRDYCAIRRERRGHGRKVTFYMHRIIMNAPEGVMIDHKNHNPLDNRRSNLRYCDYSQNNANRRSTGSSKYLGVHLKNGRPVAQIKTNNKVLYLGSYNTEEDAALAYNEAANKYHGEFANLNVVP